MSHGRRFGGLAIVLLALALCVAPARGTSSSCRLDGTTMHVGLASGETTIERGGDGASAADPVLVDGQRCGDAMVSTVDQIRARVVSGAPTLVVSLAGGPLGPGATEEPGDSDEIEIDAGYDFPDVSGDVERVHIVGSPGADQIVAGRQAINLNALEADGVDADITGGTRHRATVAGNAGDDVLRATGPGVALDQNAHFNGGDGDDLLVGGGYEDSLAGGEGADTLEGGGSGDRLDGGRGDDRVTAGEGHDVLVAGAGTDTFDGGGPDGSTTSEGDRLDYGAVTAPVVADLALGVTADDGQGGADVVSGIERLFGGRAADRLSGSEGREELQGGEGDDTLLGHGGNDRLLGDGGHDTLSLGAGNDVAYGSHGDDTLSLGAGNDVAHGEYGDDRLDGGLGDDEVSGGDGDDQFDGGDGQDMVRLDDPRRVVADLRQDDAVFAGGARESLVAVESLSASSGDDLLIGDGSANELRASRRGGTGVVRGGGGDDTLHGDVIDYSLAPAGIRTTAAGIADGEGGVDTVPDDGALVRGSDHRDEIAGRRNVEGGDGADTISGGASADVLDGGPGDDAVAGAAGADRLIAGSGNDALDGGEADDAVDYSAAPAGVVADLVAGVATVDGDGGTDTLSSIEDAVGSAHADALTGGDGASRLDGRAGGDRLTGGAGDDTLLGGPGDDRLAGGAGGDTVSFDDAGVPAGAVLDLVAGTARDGWGDDDTVGGIEFVTGTPYADELSGDARDNRLTGEHEDLVRGRGGDDVLVGGRLRGGPGDDHLGAWDQQGVADYSEAAGGIDADLATLTVSDGEGGTDTLQRHTASVLGSAHADRITGTAAWEWLDGGPGADLIDGGGGRDWLTGGAGADTLRGGDGEDEIHARDGEPDDVACGGDADGLVADHAGLDSETGCERVLRSDAPEPTPESPIPSDRPGDDSPWTAGTGGDSAAPATAPSVPSSRAGDDPPPSAGVAPGPPASAPLGVTLRARSRSLRTALRRGILARVGCRQRCVLRLELRVTRRAARRLRLRSVVVSRARVALAAGRGRSLRLRLSPKARRAVRTARTARLDLRVLARMSGRPTRIARVRLR